MSPLRLGRWWWFLAWLALALVSAASLAPLPQDLPSPPGEDLTLHVIAWAALALGFCSLAQRPWPWHWAGFLWLYSLGLEVLQSQLPHRSGEWVDGLANGAGVLLGLALAMGWGRRALAWLDDRLGRRGGR